jgi:hypothetical protein
MGVRDPYAVLGVLPSASAEEIHTAYRRVARVLHPDRFDSVRQPIEWRQATEMLAAVNEAYAFLRASHPARGTDPAQAASGRSRPAPEPHEPGGTAVPKDDSRSSGAREAAARPVGTRSKHRNRIGYGIALACFMAIVIVASLFSNLNQGTQLLRTLSSEKVEPSATGDPLRPVNAPFALSDTWLFPDSDRRLVTGPELAHLTRDQLWQARNEIYARHGYGFSTAAGKALSNRLGLPVGRLSMAQAYQQMNDVERRNVDQVLARERGR